MPIEELLGRDPIALTGKIGFTAFLLFALNRLWNWAFSSNSLRILQLEELLKHLDSRLENAERLLVDCQKERQSQERLLGEVMQKLGIAEGKLSILEQHDIEKHRNLANSIEILRKLLEKA